MLYFTTLLFTTIGTSGYLVLFSKQSPAIVTKPYKIKNLPKLFFLQEEDLIGPLRVLFTLWLEVGLGLLLLEWQIWCQLPLWRLW
jgi:hypothetical protein